MNVHGKTICIVESHEEVLADWAEAARAEGRPLMLVTLDRHTDTTPALTAEHADASDEDPDPDDDGARFSRWRKRVLARYRDASPEHLDELVERIENDEHIDAALRLGILDRALIVSSQEGSTGDVPVAGAHVYRPECAPGCAESVHGSAECARRRFDAILESEVLTPAFAFFGVEPSELPPYVLDVDLDTFSTRAGLAPRDPSVLHALIAGARLITLAREPEYVRESLDDHDPDEIEAALLQHVERATATS